MVFMELLISSLLYLKMSKSEGYLMLDFLIG